MKFLIFGIDSIERKVLKIFRTIMLALSSLVYEWIIYFYDIFVRLGRAEILTSSQVETIYSRVTLILGIFMLFKMTFSFVQYLLDPEKMSDKSKGASKLVLKAVVVVALLGTCPFIFQQAYKLQGMFLDSNVLGKVILGNDNGDVNTSNFGAQLSENLFLTFYTLAEGEECSAAGDDLQELRDEIKYNRSFWLAAACVNEEPAFKNEFVIDFAGHGIVTLAIGIFVLYIILGYCLSVGMRVVQLAFLQLIAPIPILSYLGEDKDGAFSKWVKRCVSTFLDLFIRLGIIYFVVYIITLVMDSNSDSYNLFLSTTGDPTGFTKKLLTVILILGLLMFAKKAPDLLKEVLPQGIGGNDYGFSLKKRFDNMAGMKGVKKAFGLAGGAVARAGIYGLNAYGIKKSGQRRDLENYMRNNIAGYKEKESDLLNKLNNKDISEKEYRKQIRKLNKSYLNPNSLQTKLYAQHYDKTKDKTKAEALSDKEFNAHMSEMNKIRGDSHIGRSVVGRTALGAVTGGYTGYKKGMKSVVDGSFTGALNYSKFAASGADLVDLFREYAAGITGYDFVGTNAYFGNLKFDIAQERKRLKNNITGLNNALSLTNAVDSSVSDLNSKAFADGSLGSSLVNMRNTQNAKVTTLSSLLNQGEDGCKAYLSSSDAVFENNGIWYDNVEFAQYKESQFKAIEKQRGSKLSDSEKVALNSSLKTKFFADGDTKSYTTAVAAVQHLLTDEQSRSQVLNNTIDEAYKAAAAGKAMVGSDLKLLYTDTVSNSSVNRAISTNVTALVSRSNDLLTYDTLIAGKEFGNSVASKLDFGDRYNKGKIIVDAAVEERDKIMGKEIFQTIRINDTQGNVVKFNLEKRFDSNGKEVVVAVDKDRNVYDETSLIHKIVDLSGGFDAEGKTNNPALIAKNFAQDGSLLDAIGSVEKVMKDEMSSNDDKCSAVESSIEQSDAVAQAAAASAHVEMAKALTEMRHPIPNAARGNKGGFGGSPPSGSPPGGPRGGSGPSKVA